MSGDEYSQNLQRMWWYYMQAYVRKVWHCAAHTSQIKARLS